MIRCTLRAALELASFRTGVTEVVLHRMLVQRAGPTPYRVVLRGAGTTQSIIDGLRQGPVFELARSADLTLRDLAVVRGRNSLTLRGGTSQGTVHLNAVLTAETPTYIGAATLRDYVALCIVGGQPKSQYFRDATIIDPSALAGVAGGPF